MAAPVLASGHLPWQLVAFAAFWASIPGYAATPESDAGSRLFDSYCSACHQYDEQGMGEAPPLEDAPWVDGPAERLIRIVLHGVRGRIEMGGRVYDREMPGFASVLSDEEAATLVTYVRDRFAGRTEAVAASEVRRIRERHAGRTSYWPADELLEIH